MRKNKRLLAWIMVLAMGLMTAGCGAGKDVDTSTETATEQTETEAENLIRDGGFDEGLGKWSMYTNGGSATQNVRGGEMEINVTNPGTLDYAVQPYYDGFALYQGGTYEFSFDVHATVERTLQWRLQINGGDYHAYVSDIVTIGEEVQHVTCTFTMEEPSDPAPRLCLNMGMVEGCPEDLGEHSVYFDNFELYLTDASGADTGEQTVETMGVNVNQVGYLPDAEKKAVVRADLGTEIDGDFDVINVATGKSVYTGTLEAFGENKASEENTAIADFSDVTEEGTYKIVTENYGESFQFEIGKNVYDDLAESALHMFYLQRCGEEIEDDTFGHPACHTGGALEARGTSSAYLSVLGGWHDAGDYGRYTVAGAKAVADLLLAYEAYGDQFGDDTGIPESGNGIPDLLDEVKYELDWMLTMQDPATGGVYHKITGKNFPETIMPEDETEQMYLSPISTTATADFAAVMAMASEAYKEVDPAYQQTCLEAAKKAWGYLENTPKDPSGFRNLSTIVTGEYPDRKEDDERFWALAQLYKATGEEAYLVAMKEYDEKTLEDMGTGLGWQNVAMYGFYTYLSCGNSSDVFYQSVKTIFDTKVSSIMKKIDMDAYGVSLTAGEYSWGSNMNVANNGMILLMADQLDANNDYKLAAAGQLDYLLGTNTTSYCFVTGYGSLSPESPHHRPSQVVEAAMPGMLVGGPDQNLEDPYAKAVLSEAAPAACYADNVQSYSCNEVTIYWNSPLVYLILGVEAE